MMKQAFSLLLLLLGFGVGQAQQYRMNYDPSTIPELYLTTRVFVEEKQGGEWVPLRGKYRFSTNDVSVRGDHISWTPENMDRLGGNVNFRVEVRDREMTLPLSLPTLTDIRFNMYTDSIKPVLNYFVNVEGIYSSGRIFPLTTDQVHIISDQGEMKGMEWILPKERNFEKVTFTATAKADPSLQRTITLYLNKFKDPRDAEGYEEGNDSGDFRPGRRR